VGKDAQVKQLQEAVSRHPGSPAFALLVEHHLENGEVDRALAVGQAGFAANPGYERGAVAYLTALRIKGNARTAGEVFGKAVAYLPRSARLRLQWAMTLAEAGRDQEARRFAREAMNLDPLNRDARALIATLGEAAAPFSGTQEYYAPDVPPMTDLTNELDQLFDESGSEETSGADLSSQARAQRAAASRAAVRPRVRPIGQRTTPHALFDLTPGPMMDESRHSPRSFQSSPFDITPMPLPTTPPATPEAAPPPPPAPAPTPAPPPPPGPAQTATRTPPGPPPAAHALHSPDELLRDLPQFRSRRWMWIVPLAAVGVAGLAVAGFFYYRHVQDQRLGKEVDRVVASTRPDERQLYTQARKQLADLRAKHPHDPRVLAGLALVDAHLGARLGTEPKLAAEARELLGQRRGAKGQQMARAAEVLLDAEAAGRPSTVGGDSSGGWHLLLGRLLAAPPGQRLAAARAAPAAPGGDAPAVLLEVATLLRWHGDLDESRQLVERGLKASPRHTGLLLQQILLDLAQRRPVSAKDLEPLARSGEGVPRYAAAAEVVRARLLRAKGESKLALGHAERAHGITPADPEAGMLLGRLLLGPGGDAGRALTVLERSAPTMAHYRPPALAVLARALILMGRPHEAAKALDQIPAGERQDDVLALQVRAAELTDDIAAVDSLCGKPGAEAMRLACIESYLQRSDLQAADRLTQDLKGSAANAYVRGLRSLAQGDTGGAIKRLRGVKGADLPDPVPPRLALASALARQGDSQRAVGILREAVKLDAGSVRSRVALARALVAAGHDTEAQSLLEQVLQAKPTQPSVLATAGEAFLSAGLSGRVAKLIEHGVAFNPSSTPIKILAGRVAVANNKLDQARKMFAEVLAKEPSNPEALVELGRIEAASKNPEAARKHFARALELRPRDPDLLLQLSRVHAQSGDYRSALGLGMRAIRLLRDTNQTYRTQETLVELGRVFRKGDRWAQDRAEELLFEATKAKQAPPNAYLELGLLYQQRGDHNRAVWCFRQAVEKTPTFADGYLRLGLALAKKRQWRRDAKNALHRYLELRPKGEEARRVRALLKRLR